MIKRWALLTVLTISNVALAQNYGGVWKPLDELKSRPAVTPENNNHQSAPRSKQSNISPDIDLSKLDYKIVEQRAKTGDANALFLSGLMILSGQANVEFTEENVKRAILLIQQAAMRGSPDADKFIEDMENEGIEYALQRQIKGISD